MKWLLCDSPGCVNGVCVWERQPVCWHWASPRKNRSSCWRFVRPSAAPHPTTAIERSCVCLSWYLWGLSNLRTHCLSLQSVRECVCMLKRPLWDREGLQYTLNPKLWCLIVSLCCWVGGFYLAPDALNSQLSTTNSKWHKNHYTEQINSGFSDSDWGTCTFQKCLSLLCLGNYYIVAMQFY